MWYAGRLSSTLSTNGMKYRRQTKTEIETNHAYNLSVWIENPVQFETQSYHGLNKYSAQRTNGESQRDSWIYGLYVRVKDEWFVDSVPGLEIYALLHPNNTEVYLGSRRFNK